jgi:hypothetical protein
MNVATKTEVANQLSLGDFAVEIPQGMLLATGHVELAHNQKYSIRLVNRSYYLRADAKIMIDGHHVGTWRLNTNSMIEIERPAHDTGCFTFYALGTKEAYLAELKANDHLGLVHVEFTPEVDEMFPIQFSRKEGGTGLSGSSDQRFTLATKMQLNKDLTRHIYLRLINQNQPNIKPLSRSTPIPKAYLWI